MKYVKFLFIAILFLASISSSQAAKLEWNSFEGDFLSLSDYQGKVVVVTFWATYCQPCHRNLQNLKKLYPLYKDQGFEVIAISLDDNEEVVTQHMHKLGVNFPVTLKAYTSGSKMLQNVMGTPTNYLIDRKGNIVKKQFGLMSYENLQQNWIKPII